MWSIETAQWHLFYVTTCINFLRKRLIRIVCRQCELKKQSQIVIHDFKHLVRCKNATGLCTAQCKMLHFHEKAVVREKSLNFEEGN